MFKSILVAWDGSEHAKRARKFESVTRVHARSFASTFVVQIGPSAWVASARG